MALPDPVELDELLKREEEGYDWLVPGLLERGDRLIITGAEGQGKSTLLRQISLKVAAGLHPFSDEPIEAKRVLFMDFENSERQTIRQFKPLRENAAPKAGYLHCVIWPDGIDLATDSEDFGWLVATVGELKPDLLVAGPLYKMGDGNRTEEQTALKIAKHLDSIRRIHGPAMLFEEHTPHENVIEGKKKRVVRPYGASLWKRWPEFGFYLHDGGRLEHWRGPREERDWPYALKRGEHWPWELEWSEVDRNWVMIREF